MTEPVRKLHRVAERGHVIEATPLGHEEWEGLLELSDSVPRDAEEMHALAERLFVHSTTRSLRNPVESKSGTPLLRNLRLGLMNPTLSKGDVERIDLNAAQHPVPEFNREKTTDHYVIRWTDNDPLERHRSTSATIDSVAELLEGAYLVYSGSFGKAPYLGRKALDGKIVVQVWDLPRGLEGKTSRNGVLDLDARTMANATQMPTVAAHELFHRMEYAFGMDKAFLAFPDDSWFTEGMPDWAVLFATGGWVDHGDEVTWCFEHLDKPFFADIGYWAAPAWVFLQGFRDPVTGNTAWAAKSFLEACKPPFGEFLAAFAKVCKTATASKESDDVVLAKFFNEFSLARASKRWKMTGRGYDRTEMLQGYLRLQSGATKKSIKPRLGFTAEHHLARGEATLPAERRSLAKSAANVFKITFDPAHDGRQVTIKLKCTTDGGRVYGSSAMIHEKRVANYEREEARSTGADEVSWRMTIDGARYDSLAVAVTNGPKSEKPIDYQLDVSVA